ncbi:hypothetical protein H4I95_02778 [Botrytis cinerea]
MNNGNRSAVTFHDDQELSLTSVERDLYSSISMDTELLTIHLSSMTRKTHPSETLPSKNSSSTTHQLKYPFFNSDHIHNHSHLDTHISSC